MTKGCSQFREPLLEGRQKSMGETPIPQGQLAPAFSTQVCPSFPIDHPPRWCLTGGGHAVCDFAEESRQGERWLFIMHPSEGLISSFEALRLGFARPLGGRCVVGGRLIEKFRPQATPAVTLGAQAGEERTQMVVSPACPAVVENPVCVQGLERVEDLRQAGSQAMERPAPPGGRRKPVEPFPPCAPLLAGRVQGRGWW